MKYLVLFFLILFTVQSCISTRATANKECCPLGCNIAGDEKVNTSKVYDMMDNDSIINVIANLEKKQIPLRFGIVQSIEEPMEITTETIAKAIENLNHSFRLTGFEFYLEQAEIINSELKIEDLSANVYEPYNTFSEKNDQADLLTVYIFDHGKEFCKITNSSISCGRTGGFSYILSERTNNIVLSKFDLADIKIFAHEMGHFWGLYHTFEEDQFGKDDFNEENCAEIGDRICDTPPDPGPIFEVHVNYSTCEFLNLTNEAGFEYKPMIENFMSYYKPCYLKEFAFTNDQVMVMKMASMQPMRDKFLR